MRIYNIIEDLEDHFTAIQRMPHFRHDICVIPGEKRRLGSKNILQIQVITWLSFHQAWHIDCSCK
jgi:DNA-nicking Smr family endonuclease